VNNKEFGGDASNLARDLVESRMLRADMTFYCSSGDKVGACHTYLERW